MKKTILVILLVLASSLSCLSQNQLDKKLDSLYKKSQLPGFSVALVNINSIIYLQSFGFENIANKKKLTSTKRFNIASISKTFIALGLMKLVEEQKIKLSTPINNILPFKVINPNFPKTDITIEHLANHTSGINDYEIESNSWYLNEATSLNKKIKKSIGKDHFKMFLQWKKNNKISLGSFLKETLTTNGKFYSKKRFTKNKPGTKYRYSNIGASLAAYIIELKSATPYEEYIKNLLNKELNIKDEIWKQNFKNLPTSYFQEKIETPAYINLFYILLEA